jgi:beta-lactamase class A
MRFLVTFTFLIAFLPAEAQTALADRWRAIAEDASGQVGAAAFIVETGEHAALNGSGHFAMQSVYKLPIAMAFLQKVDERKLALDDRIEIPAKDYVPRDYSPLRDRFPGGAQITIRDLLHFSLVESDGTASDVLMKLAGGPKAVTTYIQSIGVNDLVVANSEMDMTWESQYDDWCTPEAATQLLADLQKRNVVSPASRALTLDDMQESQTGRNRIRNLLPEGTTVADKTGTSWTRNGRTAATNDIGLITLPDGRHLALAIFVADSTAPDAIREKVIARIARAAWDQWVHE